MLGMPAAPDTMLLLLLLPGGTEEAAVGSELHCPAATMGVTVPATAGAYTHVLPCCCGLLVISEWVVAGWPKPTLFVAACAASAASPAAEDHSSKTEQQQQRSWNTRPTVTAWSRSLHS